MLLQQLYRSYNQLWEHGDQRVKDWPLMQTPLATIIICLLYVYTVKVAGPKLMRNRKPFDIRYLMIIYNFTMIFASLYLFYRLGIHGWFGKYNFKCQPVDYSSHRDAIGMATIAYWYYISKFVEFFDTIFFVLRKKYDHISTLHVIHHGIMPMSVWWGVKFTPGGHSSFFAFINSFIHILMYTYYGIAAIGPQMYKYLWWKKYMTAAQMIQFILIFVHSFQLIFRSCDYPKGFMWFIGFHAILFWFLFWDFYKEEYHRKKDAAIRAKASLLAAESQQQHKSSLLRSSTASIFSISSVFSKLGSVCTPDTTKLMQNGNHHHINTTNNNNNYIKNGHFTSELNNNNNEINSINNNHINKNNNNNNNSWPQKTTTGTYSKNRSELNTKQNLQNSSNAYYINHQDGRKNK